MAKKNKNTGGNHKKFHNRTLNQRAVTGDNSAKRTITAGILNGKYLRKKLALACAKSR